MKKEIIEDIYRFEKELKEKYKCEVNLTFSVHPVSLTVIIYEVILLSGVNIKDKCRQRDYIICRAIYYKLARENNYTLTEIGAELGKDHATVLYALRKFDQLLLQKDYLANYYYNKIINQ